MLGDKGRLGAANQTRYGCTLYKSCNQREIGYRNASQKGGNAKLSDAEVKAVVDLHGGCEIPIVA